MIFSFLHQHLGHPPHGHPAIDDNARTVALAKQDASLTVIFGIVASVHPDAFKSSHPNEQRQVSAESWAFGHHHVVSSLGYGGLPRHLFLALGQCPPLRFERVGQAFPVLVGEHTLGVAPPSCCSCQCQFHNYSF